MSAGQIKVDEQSLRTLREALASAGETYKHNLARLNSLIEQITNGDIKGNPANDLLTKYKAKEAIFRGLANTIDEAEGYVGLKNKKFSDMIGNMSSKMG